MAIHKESEGFCHVITVDSIRLHQIALDSSGLQHMPPINTRWSKQQICHLLPHGLIQSTAICCGNLLKTAKICKAFPACIWICLHLQVVVFVNFDRKTSVKLSVHTLSFKYLDLLTEHMSVHHLTYRKWPHVHFLHCN